MRKSHILTILFAVGIALLLWWRIYRPENPVSQQPDAKETTQSKLSPMRPRNLAFGVSNAQVPTPESNFTAWNEQRLQKMSNDLERGRDEWRTPIAFYGKVVDEKTNPVADANVEFGCNDLSAEGTSNYHTNTDNNGYFSISGVTGKLLSVKVAKPGYYTSKQDNGYFTYAGANTNFVPDASEPVIFHLRKRAKGESLITTDFPGYAHIAQLHHDGTPIELNLLTGALATSGNGQLKLEFWRDVSDTKAGVFDWKFQLSIANGGLLPTDDEFAFQAPQNGYQPSTVIDMPATNQNWQAEIRNEYYIQLDNGNYGRIDLYLLPRNGVFTVHSVINPSGSSNLEPAQ